MAGQAFRKGCLPRLLMNTTPLPDGDSPPVPADRYRAGTLQYTKPGLVMLFFWLLLGAFAFALMRALIPLISYDAGDGALDPLPEIEGIGRAPT